MPICKALSSACGLQMAAPNQRAKAASLLCIAWLVGLSASNSCSRPCAPRPGKQAAKSGDLVSDSTTGPSPGQTLRCQPKALATMKNHNTAKGVANGA